MNNEPKTKENSPPIPGLIRLAVLPVNYPDDFFTNEQVKLCEKTILDQVIALRSSTLKPKFQGSQHRPGFLLVRTLDKATADWLRSIVDQLKPWPEAKIKIMDMEQMDDCWTVSTYFPDSEDDPEERIFTYLQSQNYGLKTGAWRMVEQKKGSGSCSMVVPPQAINILKERNMTLYYKFGTVKFKMGAPSKQSPKKT